MCHRTIFRFFFVCRVHFIQTTVFNFNHRHFESGVKNAIGILFVYNTTFASVSMCVCVWGCRFYFDVALFIRRWWHCFIPFLLLDIDNDNINNMHTRFVHISHSVHILIKRFPNHNIRWTNRRTDWFGSLFSADFIVGMVFCDHQLYVCVCVFFIISHENLLHRSWYAVTDKVNPFNQGSRRVDVYIPFFCLLHSQIVSI